MPTDLDPTTTAHRDFTTLTARLATETHPVRRRILSRLIDAALDRALAAQKG